MAAVTITGLVLAVENGSAPMPYFWLFALIAIVCTLLVEPRGLFLTVAPLPVYFVACAVFIGWLTSPANTRGGTKTKLITAIYPAVEHFLWLLFPFLICVGIAVFRWRRFHHDATSKAQQAAEQRRRLRAADESNRSTYERSRTRTVDELLSAAEERRARRAAREEREGLVARPAREEREATQPRSRQSDGGEARPVRGEQGRTERRSANHGRHSADQRFPSQGAQPGSHSTRVVSGIPEVRRERAARRSVSPLPPRSTESTDAPRPDGSAYGSQDAHSEARHSADAVRHAQSAHDGRAGRGAREPRDARNTASARDTADARDAWAVQPYGRHSRPGQRYRPVSKKPDSDSEFRLTDD